MYIMLEILLIPFLGTSLGAGLVFLTKNKLNLSLERLLTGFSAGIMVAASIFSLLVPAIDQSENMGRSSFFPAVLGFCLGMCFLLILDVLTPHLHLNSVSPEGPAGIKERLKKTTMMVFAVVLHNIPEGMAVGVVYSGFVNGNTAISVSSAFILSLGIAIQNFPEGAIISMPLHALNVSKSKSFLYGVLSGAVEPVAGLITIFLSALLTPLLPYLLSFAAGAMIYVVVEELIPEMSEEPHSNIGTIAFMIGFSLMMTLDVALG